MPPISFTKIENFSLKAYILRRFSKRDIPFWRAFGIIFILLNIIFLFHSAHLMFGDHDWSYIKNGIPLSSGLFEGRFSQFILINLLSSGEILPIVNNALGFLGYALGVALLARYWHLPHTNLHYTLFALFASITPYILSFMYFAFLIIPVLSWNAFIIGGLLISENESTFSLKKSLSAIILFTLALGGYPPVINLFATALIAHLLIIRLIHKKPLFPLSSYIIWTIINFLIAIGIYKLCLIYLTHTGAINPNYYNLQTTPISEWGNKAILVISDLFKQFSITLPFIPLSYKVTAIGITLTALFATISKTLSTQRKTYLFPSLLLNLLLFFGIFLSALLTLFISTSLAETEFSPRIDFFGYTYALSAMYAICLINPRPILRNFATLIAISSIFLSIHLLFEAQKVWNLGFLAEQKLYKRVLKRYETNPLFNPQNHYIMVQGGAPTFREKYYHTPYTHKSDDLLGISYVPGLAPGVMWNFDAQNEYADKTSYVYTFKPDADAINALSIASPYPSATSVAVGSYWILVVLTPNGLQSLRTTYH